MLVNVIKSEIFCLIKIKDIYKEYKNTEDFDEFQEELHRAITLI